MLGSDASNLFKDSTPRRHFALFGTVAGAVCHICRCYLRITVSQGCVISDALGAAEVVCVYVLSRLLAGRPYNMTHVLTVAHPRATSAVPTGSKPRAQRKMPSVEVIATVKALSQACSALGLLARTWPALYISELSEPICAMLKGPSASRRIAACLTISEAARRPFDGDIPVVLHTAEVQACLVQALSGMNTHSPHCVRSFVVARLCWCTSIELC